MFIEIKGNSGTYMYNYKNTVGFSEIDSSVLLNLNLILEVNYLSNIELNSILELDYGINYINNIEGEHIIVFKTGYIEKNETYPVLKNYHLKFSEKGIGEYHRLKRILESQILK